MQKILFWREKKLLRYDELIIKQQLECKILGRKTHMSIMLPSLNKKLSKTRQIVYSLQMQILLQYWNMVLLGEYALL